MRYKNIGSLIEPEGWSLEKELDNITYDKVIEQYDKYYQLKDWQISLDKDMKK